MAPRVLPLDEFIDGVICEAFNLSEEKFAPIPADDRKKYVLGLTTQLYGGKPKRFLSFLETTEDPKTLVEDTFEVMNGFPPEYVIQPRSGELDREHINSVFAVRNVEHIIQHVFHGTSHSSFGDDLKNIYEFLKQKTSEALAENGSGSVENGLEAKLDIRDEERKELIAKYANALFSVHLLIKKLTKHSNVGQYL
ncbi:MAG: hypothetical protein A3H69_01325 [Candidatus Sungbacteria bacterium RIFCSPLOWO2_02_FULL_47_9]|uniref:Uncharacterized protein n=1 Tax=Candidatus Sungbacteria bacterium RIFCSPHIGHO2_01_FULL_47_32 TaxID=1802264 RepID=A0A1G2K5N7_9BACT|nr:MAG: hypothetical protein UX72_C0015G0003 [Parcubacteria group bacterium GW2011_GWA2_47_10]OGZ93891.1 MAG: hypothetical protein A2633_05240 [Candidatus Sungbacteria bacterium RIFCSPHIGHO2_01_FULL_47_32]OGZ99143.1 MAG: hypothetical protein A3D57_05290 [Candidatus Sungbacteria bacterium RIFCSPHIGHO2_02_FULL_46_12]OHA06019.1 MAG: hypothetical protein A3A28_05300 [Candidatus Sungbacteria bacterium RIFCSPLOWO2_01_FULL_47_32]OHA10338.1 MAG: hypothetical protein A3H69_01325 [Candidatus Sungbacteria